MNQFIVQEFVAVFILYNLIYSCKQLKDNIFCHLLKGLIVLVEHRGFFVAFSVFFKLTWVDFCFVPLCKGRQDYKSERQTAAAQSTLYTD